jgi:hypothetical protein
MARRVRAFLRTFFDERGDLLSNFIIGTIATVVLMGVGGPFILPTILDRAHLADTLTGQIEHARAYAVTNSGAGATLYVNAGSGTTTIFTLYAGRPEPGNSISAAVTTEPYNGTVSYNGATQFAILFSSSGSVSAVAWTPGNTIAAEPACAGSLTFSVATAIATRTVTAQCQ